MEGIKEETLVSTEHALSLIAAGDANRKVRQILAIQIFCLPSPIWQTGEICCISPKDSGAGRAIDSCNKSRTDPR